MRRSTRKSKAERGSLVLIPVALIVTLVSGLWAWKLASSQFPAEPLIANPGSIIVTAYGYEASRVPVDVNVVYDGSVSKRTTGYQIFLDQYPPTSAGSKPYDVAVFLCGAAEKGSHLTSNGAPATWQSGLKLANGQAVGSYPGFMFPYQCIYTIVGLAPNVAGEGREAYLSGYSGSAPSRTSGSGVIYAWPGVQTFPASFQHGDVRFFPLAGTSSFTASFQNFPIDISNVVTDPELTPDSEGFHDSGSFSGGSVEQFRLSATLSARQVNSAKDLFVAGALVGVAGAGLIWLLESVTRMAVALKDERETETDGDGYNKGDREHAEATGSIRDKPTSGLGWPDAMQLSEGTPPTGRQRH
jgi:hypothetical protein